MSIATFLYFGTPEFSRIVLEELLKSGLKPAAVITAPDKPVGRKQVLTASSVAAFASKNGIEVLKPEKIKPPEFIEKLRSFEPDFIIVAAYGKIIPQAILDIPKHGAINVHPSLLPQWRGASPIPYTIVNGDSKTGVTIMLMDAEMDHGPILVQEEVALRGDETTTTLTAQLARLGGQMLGRVVPDWLAGNITPTEQDHDAATFTKILTKEDGRIDWSKSAVEIERQVRAFDPWPGAWTVWPRKEDETILKLLEVRIKNVRHSEGAERPKNPRVKSRDEVLRFAQNDQKTEHDGQRVFGGVMPEGIITGDGLIEPILVQLAGKRPMSWLEFLRGYRDFAGSSLR